MQRVLPEFSAHDSGRHEREYNSWMTFSVLSAEVCGESIEKMLCSVVRGSRDKQWNATQHRGDVHYLSLTALLEVRQNFLHAIHRRLHIHLHHAVDVII